jgi:hypothetical protein
MTTRRLLIRALAALALLLAVPPAAHGQFLSSGRLAQAHTELEGLRNCTSCHQLGQRGISPERCLSCHEELGTRIASDRGYHASVTADTCADCHQDHLGTEFDLRRLDESTFDHVETGYRLELSHASVDCRDCHQASRVRDPAVVARMTAPGALARTFLGLPTDCMGCHRDQSPHGDQFGTRACTDCHDADAWETPPNFEHAVTTFPLEGLHAAVDCVDCHGTGEEAIYRPIEFSSCNNCHEDPHAGARSGTCASCHRTAGWTIISTENMERTFDHSTTGFPLAGAHTNAECRACHVPGRPPRTALLAMTYLTGTQGSTYPRPLFDTCRACHVEQHPAPAGEVRWSDCEACHSEILWAPSPYNLARHAESVFPLDGAHVVTPCVACHQDADRGHDAFTLSLPGQACLDCHQADDPHEGLYEGQACSDCHVTDAWQDATFDHAVVLDRPSPEACTTCHATDDPHQSQFENRGCEQCHGNEVFTIELFDHAATNFPLDGAHDDGPCTSCHLTEPGPPAFVRYQPVGTECADCHTGVL